MSWGVGGLAGEMGTNAGGSLKKDLLLLFLLLPSDPTGLTSVWQFVGYCCTLLVVSMGCSTL